MGIEIPNSMEPNLLENHSNMIYLCVLTSKCVF